jgi:hypothetical protein
VGCGRCSRPQGWGARWCRGGGSKAAQPHGQLAESSKLYPQHLMWVGLAVVLYRKPRGHTFVLWCGWWGLFVSYLMVLAAVPAHRPDLHVGS